RASIAQQLDNIRRRFQLHKLLDSVLRSLEISAVLLVLLCLLTVLIAVVFYYVNRNGHTDSERYKLLKAREAEYNRSLAEVVQMSGKADLNKTLLAEKLSRLRQLGRNLVYKDIKNAIKQHELRPTFTQSMYYAVTLVSLIGYGDIAGASELQYFCASLCMLIVVPLYCYRRWVHGQQVESRSNRTMMVLWAVRIRNADVYRRSRFYLSNLVLMIVIFPVCWAVFSFSERQLALKDQLWLIVQSIFHIGLGDVPPQAANWPVIFLMISTCFLIYFQCFAFIVPQYPSMRLARILQNHYS
uniref:Ion_trans_2 domain-containing protein n=1 Tax=Macrostomum lignano TaxID=282301 RepID=A0A1I8GSD0_9PLAT